MRILVIEDDPNLNSQINIKHAIDGIIVQDYGKGLISENLLCWIKQFSLKINTFKFPRALCKV